MMNTPAPAHRILRAARALLAASPLTWLAVPPLRHLVEASMSLHMLLQFPLLLAAGWASSAWWPARARAVLARFDGLGLASATLAACVSAFWMIPSALDLAVLDGRMAVAKYLSWFATGLLLAQGWQRLGAEISAFLLGNVAWMLVTAGLLYREAQGRLCVSYRFDEQLVTGSGLMLWGFAIGALALLRLQTMMRRAGETRSSP